MRPPVTSVQPQISQFVYMRDIVNIIFNLTPSFRTQNLFLFHRFASFPIRIHCLRRTSGPGLSIRAYLPTYIIIIHHNLFLPLSYRRTSSFSCIMIVVGDPRQALVSPRSSSPVNRRHFLRRSTVRRAGILCTSFNALLSPSRVSSNEDHDAS